MTTESQIAPESAAGLGGTSSGAFIARPTRWRLPIAYGSIASIALCVDLALILGSAAVAEAIYHKVPDAFEGEFSHTIAAAIFVAILFVAVDAGAKALQSNPADGVGRPGSQRAGRLVRGLPDPSVGRVQLGGEPRSVAWRRSFVLGGRRRGASRAQGGMEIRSAERPGKRRA